MIPFDGDGYGRSDYWSYFATLKAREIGEACGHEDLSTVFQSNVYFPYYLDTRVRCNFCGERYPRTEKKVLEQYNKIYGIAQ